MGFRRDGVLEFVYFWFVCVFLESALQQHCCVRKHNDANGEVLGFAGFLEGTYQKDMFDRPLKIYTLLGHIKSVQIRNHFVSRSIVGLP